MLKSVDILYSCATYMRSQIRKDMKANKSSFGPNARDNNAQICRHFQWGTCFYGDKCYKRHEYLPLLKPISTEQTELKIFCRPTLNKTGKQEIYKTFSESELPQLLPNSAKRPVVQQKQDGMLSTFREVARNRKQDDMVSPSRVVPQKKR